MRTPGPARELPLPPVSPASPHQGMKISLPLFYTISLIVVA
jgi:hypothetical protein